MTRVDILKEIVRERASELGISHQKTLNELARRKGFSDWGAMRRHLDALPALPMPAIAPRIPPLPELQPLPEPARPMASPVLDEEGADAVARYSANPSDEGNHARCDAFKRAWKRMFQLDEELDEEWEEASIAERWGIVERMGREEDAIPERLRIPLLAD